MHVPFLSRHRRPIISITASVAFLALVGALSGVATANGANTPDALPEIQVSTTSPDLSPPAESAGSAMSAQSVSNEATTAPPALPERPALLVAASERGRLVTIDSSSGRTEKVLATYPVENCGAPLGENISISPDSKSVYFERRIGESCAQSIWRVATTGGDPVRVVEGVTPRISPDGTSMAYFKITHQSFEWEGVSTDQTSIGDLVSRDLKTGAERTIATDVMCGCGGQAFASWALDGKHLVVQGTNCGCGGAPFEELRIYDAAKTNSFHAVPLKENVLGKSAWAYASYMPSGDLFVLEIPNTPFDEKTETFKATGVPRMIVVDPETGKEKKQITTGFEDRRYSSADVDASGQHLMYLSNGNLMVSDGMARPSQLATGLVGAAW